MGYFKHWLLILQCVVVFVFLIEINGNPLVPALCIFGDSTMDVGNNNRLPTLLRANFLPYGRDFISHKPTGRFCNGKLAADYAAEYLGFHTYPPPYLDTANETLLLKGANFASAGSGYYERTSNLYQAISIPRQVSNYKIWQKRVVRLVGNETAKAIFSGGIHILSAGNSDFLLHYYISPILRTTYPFTIFRYASENILQIRAVTNSNTIRQVQNLYSLGVRKIGVTTLPPTGCLPAAITLFGMGSNNCISRLNNDTVVFNKKLNATSSKLIARFPDLKLVVFDVYHPLLDMITKSAKNGFFESRRGCCGTGILETSILCNAISIGTCSNATEYVFWDAFHTSDAANQILAQNLLHQGLALIS